MPPQQHTIFTIGHSTHPIEIFIAMLRSFDIKLLADIRSFPGSRKYPHFNKAELEASVNRAGIQYIHFPDLGGRRKPTPDSVNTAWRSAAFKGYADYMETAAFRDAIAQLQLMAVREATA